MNEHKSSLHKIMPKYKILKYIALVIFQVHMQNTTCESKVFQ